MTFYESLNVADSASLKASGLVRQWGVYYWPDQTQTGAANSWYNVGDSIDWVLETSTNTPSGGGGTTNPESGGAMMLAQGLAAGAAILAAISF